MASTRATELAEEILDACLQDGTWPARALDALVHRALDDSDLITARNATRALFSIVIERLADLFEPNLCEVYARLFTHVIARTVPDYQPDELLLRYHRVRQLRRFAGGEVRRVFVLSRVTLGADVAVTSVVLAAMKARFPDAEICFVGPEKNAALFAADARVIPIPVVYGRGALLAQRMAAAFELQTTVDEPGSIVVDPDSRLTQLGLIPVCDDARYYFFESRSFGDDSRDALPDLTAEWLAEVFSLDEKPRPYLSPVEEPKIADITVSLGVGENETKRMGSDFEFEVLSALLKTGRSVLIDRGAGGEEADRVNALLEKLGHPATLHVHDGSYASFASHIVKSQLYFGYDSAGQHVASAARVPLVSVFAGFACDRMFARWRPTGPHSHVICVDDNNAADVLQRTLKAISEAVAEP